MPTVPRNTITETRIDRRPGVQSFTPRGAEALGSVASAVGQQADLYGQKARVEGQQYAAMQDALGQVNQAVVNVDRIQRIRAARQVDEGELDYHQHMNNGTTGYNDPETGEHVQGAYETPFTPPDDQGEGTGAQQATAKLHAAWFEKKDGKFSAMSPRAQEEVKKRLTAKFMVYENHAKDIDQRNRDIRRKALDEAATKANLDFVAQNAANPTTRGPAILAAAASMTLQGNRHLIANPDAATVDEAQFTDDKTKAAFGQAMKENTSKVSLHVADSLLTQADAAPDDATASRLLDDAVAFSKDAGEAKLFAPDLVAKVELKAKDIRQDRQRRAKVKEAEFLKDAEDAAVDVWLAPSEKSLARFSETASRLTPEQQGRFTRFQEDLNLLNDKRIIEEADAIYRTTNPNLAPREKEWSDTVMRLTSPQGRALFQEIEQKRNENRMKGESKVAKRVAEAGREIANSELLFGIAPTANGGTRLLSPVEQTERAMMYAKEGIITAKDLEDFRSHLSKTINEPALVEDAIDITESVIGVPDLREKMAYSSEARRFDAIRKKGIPAIRDTEDIGASRVTIDNRQVEIEGLTAKLVREVMTAAVEYQTQMKAKGEYDPLKMRDYIEKLFDPGVDGTTASKLYAARVEANLSEHQELVNQIYLHTATKMHQAVTEGQRKGLSSNAND